jgi:type I restriction enzyme R subunit
MNKKNLTEADIRTKFITPALEKDKHGSWDLMTQFLEEHYFTKGRVIVRGQTVHRGEAKKADYILFYKPNIPIAVIEAKDNNQTVGAGMQQALDYAETLDLPFAYSSNGDAFLEHNRLASANPVEREIPLDRSVPEPGRTLASLQRRQGLHAPTAGRSNLRLLRRWQRQEAPLLPGQCHQPHGRRHCSRRGSHSARPECVKHSETPLG